MEELIHNWIFNYGLVAIFFLMVSNGFISTPPSEIVLSLSGVISYLTGLNIFSIFFAALLANYLGAFIPYLIGRRVGYSWLLKLKIYFSGKNKFFNWIAKYIPSEPVILLFAEKFKGNGSVWVGIFRCFPMVRSTITSLPAGIIKMPFLKYTLFTVAGMSVWTVFWLSIGYFVGEAWHQIKTVGTIVLIVVLLAIIYYLKIVAQRYIEKHLGKIE